jgi:hypothetical protein
MRSRICFFLFLFSRICANTFAMRPYGRTRRRETSIAFSERKETTENKTRGRYNMLAQLYLGHRQHNVRIRKNCVE